MKLLFSLLLLILTLAFVGGWLFGSRRRKTALLSSIVLVIATVLSLLLLGGCRKAPAPTVAAPTITKTTEAIVTAGAIQSPLTSPLSTPTPDTGKLDLPLTGTVVFQSDRQGNFDIWQLRLDNMKLRQLTTATARDIEPAWSPDGKQIVFASGRDDPNNLQLYVMNADGSQQHRLFKKVQKWDNWFPAWSPDGKKILYQSNRNVHQNGFDLYVADVDGTHEVQLTHTPEDESHASWSPDGKKIVYVSNKAGNSDIWVMNADGSSPRQLTTNPNGDGFPRWSPDGRHILFVSDREGYQRLFIMDSDGKNVRRLSAKLPADDTMPNWALDGKAVVFASNRANKDWEIYIMSVASGKWQRLTIDFPLIMDRYPAWHQ